ncbi:hypothetical protein IWX90DRAFT_439935 [Phyllosticta citrichinensis]|uniref:Secreted protein n=1 Tax=Phyllosticta citrichinensis TaxID=1130410 RepID=A0ABR1XKS4_9PEZI
MAGWLAGWLAAFVRWLVASREPSLVATDVFTPLLMNDVKRRSWVKKECLDQIDRASDGTATSCQVKSDCRFARTGTTRLELYSSPSDSRQIL